MKPGLLLARIRRGDLTNVNFDDLVRLVLALGFREVGGRGSHRVFPTSGSPTFPTFGCAPPMGRPPTTLSPRSNTPSRPGWTPLVPQADRRGSGRLPARPAAPELALRFEFIGLLFGRSRWNQPADQPTATGHPADRTRPGQGRDDLSGVAQFPDTDLALPRRDTVRPPQRLNDAKGIVTTPGTW
ncbi:MAG: type II toxin-antitoxin system HicA family toxin [Pseudonocardiaceae bacterium]